MKQWVRERLNGAAGTPARLPKLRPNLTRKQRRKIAMKLTNVMLNSEEIYITLLALRTAVSETRNLVFRQACSAMVEKFEAIREENS